MKRKDTSLFDQLFNLPPPWRASLALYSVDTVLFTIEYRSSVITCPVCRVQAEVIRKRKITWKPRDFLGYQVTMTAALPVVAPHNPECRVNKEQSVLGNTLFLDLILRQAKFTQIHNPFPYFFSAAEAPSKLSLPRLDDEAWRLSPYPPQPNIEVYHEK